MTISHKITAIVAAVIFVIGSIFLYGYVQEQKARAAFEAEAKVRQEEQAKSADQIKALQKQLGPKAQDDGESLSDGPGTRRVMSNAAWRANTAKQWDGE